MSSTVHLAVELERCGIKVESGCAPPISTQRMLSRSVPGSAFSGRRRRRGEAATATATETATLFRHHWKGLGVCLVFCWTCRHHLAAAAAAGVTTPCAGGASVMSRGKSRGTTALILPPSIQRRPINRKNGRVAGAAPWSWTTSVLLQMSTRDTGLPQQSGADSSSGGGVGSHGAEAEAVTTYLDTLCSGSGPTTNVPSDSSGRGRGPPSPSTSAARTPPSPSAEAIASYLESLSSASSTAAEASENRLDDEDEGASSGAYRYLDAIAKECNADAPGSIRQRRLRNEDCASAIKFYLDALSAGRSAPSARAASLLASHLDDLSKRRRRRPVPVSPSAAAAAGDAVASYLDAVSSRSVPSPSVGAVSSYLDAIATGEVLAPSSVEAVASYLDAVWALKGQTVDGSWASVTIASRSHLEAIARACNADDVEGEGCREAVEDYARAIVTGEVRPSLEDFDDDEAAVPVIGPATAGGGGEPAVTSVAADTAAVCFGTTADTDLSSPPSSSVASTAEIQHQQQLFADGNRLRGRTLYDVLHVSPDATRGELKRQYVALARLSHPDAVSSTRKGASARLAAQATPTASVDPSSGTAAPPDFVEIASAYRVLSDPKQRRRYDRSLWAESFTRDVERAAENIGRVAGPRVVELFERVALPLMEGAAATSAAAILAVANASSAATATTTPGGDGDGDAGGIQRR